MFGRTKIAEMGLASPVDERLFVSEAFLSTDGGPVMESRSCRSDRPHSSQHEAQMRCTAPVPWPRSERSYTSEAGVQTRCSQLDVPCAMLARAFPCRIPAEHSCWNDNIHVRRQSLHLIRSACSAKLLHQIPITFCIGVRAETCHVRSPPTQTVSVLDAALCSPFRDRNASAPYSEQKNKPTLKMEAIYSPKRRMILSRLRGVIWHRREILNPANGVDLSGTGLLPLYSVIFQASCRCGQLIWDLWWTKWNWGIVTCILHGWNNSLFGTEVPRDPLSTP
jgi:hypothetical protein